MSDSPTWTQQAGRAPASRPRVFLWFFLAIQLLFAVVLVVGLVVGFVDTSSVDTSGEFGGLTAALAGFRVFAAAGAVLVTWFVVNAFLAVTYFTYRKAREL